MGLYDYDFAAELDDQLWYPAYNSKIWPSRKAWIDEMYEQGCYWIEDDYDENGEPKKKTNQE